MARPPYPNQNPGNQWPYPPNNQIPTLHQSMPRGMAGYPQSPNQPLRTPPPQELSQEDLYYQPDNYQPPKPNTPVSAFTYIFMGLFIIILSALVWELFIPYNFKISTAMGLVTPESTLNTFEECELAGGELTQTSPQNCKINGIIYTPEIDRSELRKQLESELTPKIEEKLRPRLTQEIVAEVEEQIRAEIEAEHNQQQPESTPEDEPEQSQSQN